MADERMVPLEKPGEMVNLAMTPADFFGKKLLRKGDAPVDSMQTADMETYADAGYTLGDYYEDMTPYDGPKTKRQYETQQEERKAERAAARAEAPKPAADDKPKAAEAKKAD